MKIFSLYKDFFRFLERISSGSSQWEDYITHYFHLHQEFLEDYFSCFPRVSLPNLRQRVEKIKASDYSWLKHLVSICPPEEIIKKAYGRCRRFFPAGHEPEVYLFIGFFSPDAFVMDHQGQPVICFGLERFRDFRLLKILFAHEFAHFLLNLNKGEVPESKRAKWLLISEGIGTYFSFLAFPERTLPDHLLLGRDIFNWCQDHEDDLRRIFSSKKFTQEELIEIFRMGKKELGIPPRAGKYLGFQAVKRSMETEKQRPVDALFSDKLAFLSLNL